MTSRLNPDLNFNGNARKAMEFYASVFGGERPSPRSLSSVPRARMLTGSCTPCSRPMPATRSWPPTCSAPWTTIRWPGSRSASAATMPACFAATSRSCQRMALRRDAAAEAGLGRRVRHVHGQVRRVMAGQHRTGVTAPSRAWIGGCGIAGQRTRDVTPATSRAAAWRG